MADLTTVEPLVKSWEQYVTAQQAAGKDVDLDHWLALADADIDHLLTYGYLDGVIDSERVVSATNLLGFEHWRTQERVALYQRLQQARTRAEGALALRTQIAHARLAGRLAAWGLDPRKTFYWYYWRAHPTHDPRTKDVSLVFERNNPYEYHEIKKLYDTQHQIPQFVWNRETGRWGWQTSMYNCRCDVSRAPKSTHELAQQGLIARMRS